MFQPSSILGSLENTKVNQFALFIEAFCTSWSAMRNWSGLISNALSSKVVIIAGYFNIQKAKSEAQLIETDSGNCLIHVCTRHELFLANANFCHQHWHPSSPVQR